MATIAKVSRQILDIERQVSELRQESIHNVGLLAVAYRRGRAQLAAIEQERNIRQLGPHQFLIGWDPRQGQFSKADFAQSLEERLRGSANVGAGEPAALQSEIGLRDVLDSMYAVLLSSIGNERLELGSGTAVRDIRLERAGAKTLQLDDTADGPINVWLAGDLVATLGATWSISYNGDGTVASISRTGAAGAASTVVTYFAGKVNSIVTTIAGKTVTITPTYTADQITAIDRAVA